MTGITTTQLTSLKKIYSGKVRDLYEIDDKRMLMIATDRLSAFDVILDEPIPEKGKILTAISNFWFDKLKDVVPNHLTGDRAEDLVSAADLPQVRPWRGGQAADAGTGGSHCARLSGRFGLEGIPAVRHGVRHHPARRLTRSQPAA